MGEIEYRLSSAADKDKWRKLWERSFWKDTDYEMERRASGFNGKYILAYDGDRLVGMSRVSDSTEYDIGINGYNNQEIGWTCVDVDYRGRGIASELVRLALQYQWDSTRDIYSFCWRTHGRSRVNLYNAMIKNGFEEYIRDFEQKKCLYDINLLCTLKNGKPGYCVCSNDLWVKRCHPEI